MAIVLIQKDGQRIKLRWTDQHRNSIDGNGVLLFRHSNQKLKGIPRNATIQVETISEASRVARALQLTPDEAKRLITQS